MVTLYNRPTLTREESKARAVRMMEMMAHGYTVQQTNPHKRRKQSKSCEDDGDDGSWLHCTTDQPSQEKKAKQEL